MAPRTKPPKLSLGVRELQKQKTRAALLAAARSIVKRRGFAKTTTREVAEVAGVSVGTVFLHFSDVGALVEALLDEHIQAALASAFRTLPKDGDLVRRLVYVSKKLFESYDIEPDLSREYISASLFRQSRDGTAAARLVQFQSWVAAQVGEAVAAGTVAEVDPNVAFATFFSLYFGVLVAGLRGQLDRKAQLVLLEASLRHFFRTEVRK